MAGASRRVLMAFNMQPAMPTPKWASRCAGTLGATTATVSPRFRPAAAMAAARRRERSYKVR